jgi:hypothetical protein
MSPNFVLLNDGELVGMRLRRGRSYDYFDFMEGEWKRCSMLSRSVPMPEFYVAQEDFEPPAECAGAGLYRYGNGSFCAVRPA